MGTDYWIWG